MKDLIKLINEQVADMLQALYATNPNITGKELNQILDELRPKYKQTLTTTIKTLLEAEVERLKGKLRDLEQIEKECRTKEVLPAKRKRALSVAFGNNKAIEAELTHTQQLLDELNAT